MKLLSKFKKLPITAKVPFWFFVCSFLQKFISTILTPVITRLMTTSEYGNYNVFNSWMSILSIIVTLQLYSGLYEQGLIKFQDEKSLFSSSLQGLNIFLCGIWFIIYFVFRNYFNSLFGLTTIQICIMFILLWTTAVFRFWSAEQRVEYKYKYLVIVTLCVSVFKPMLTIIFVYFANDKVTACVLGMAISELLCYTILFFKQIRKGKKLLSSKYWKYAISFALPLIPHYLAQVVLASSDRIMIQKMVGEGEAGIYSLGYTISSIMTLFNTTLSQTISPWLYAKIKNKELDSINKVTVYSLVFVAILNLMLIIVAPDIVIIFAPKDYYNAIWIIPPVAMSVFYMFMYDFFSKFEFYYEKKYFIMIASIIGAIANIILNIVFIPCFGYIAAGYTTLICYILYCFAHYVFMLKIQKEKGYKGNVFNPKMLVFISILFMLFGGLIMLLYYNNTIRYSIIVAGCAVLLINLKKIQKVFKYFLKRGV